MQRVTMKLLLLGIVFFIAAPAQAALIDRGNGLIYDDVLDITWLQDASQGGHQTWDNAVAWADALIFEGFDDWRLPSISRDGGLPTGQTFVPVDCRFATEMDCRDNELGYMYYRNLGGTGDNLAGNQGLIENVQFRYWSGTERDPSFAWVFDFSFGARFDSIKFFNHVAWAVRPGDVLAAAPEPGTWLLLGVGALGLVRARKRGRPTR